MSESCTDQCHSFNQSESKVSLVQPFNVSKNQPHENIKEQTHLDLMSGKCSSIFQNLKILAKNSRQIQVVALGADPDQKFDISLLQTSTLQWIIQEVISDSLETTFLQKILMY